MPAPVTLTFDLLILKVVPESRVTWATFLPILVFLAGLSVLDLGPMYATDRRQTDRRQRASSLNAPAQEAGHNNSSAINLKLYIVFLLLIFISPPYRGRAMPTICVSVNCEQDIDYSKKVVHGFGRNFLTGQHRSPAVKLIIGSRRGGGGLSSFLYSFRCSSILVFMYFCSVQ